MALHQNLKLEDKDWAFLQNLKIPTHYFCTLMSFPQPETIVVIHTDVSFVRTIYYSMHMVCSTIFFMWPSQCLRRYHFNICSYSNLSFFTDLSSREIDSCCSYCLIFNSSSKSKEGTLS